MLRSLASSPGELASTRSKVDFVSARLKRRHPGRLFSKLWLPAVAVVVIAIIGYGVKKVRHSSDAISYPPSSLFSRSPEHGGKLLLVFEP